MISRFAKLSFRAAQDVSTLSLVRHFPLPTRYDTVM
jgi:hypothetical protein